MIKPCRGKLSFQLTFQFGILLCNCSYQERKELKSNKIQRFFTGVCHRSCVMISFAFSVNNSSALDGKLKFAL